MPTPFPRCVLLRALRERPRSHHIAKTVEPGVVRASARQLPSTHSSIHTQPRKSAFIDQTLTVQGAGALPRDTKGVGSTSTSGKIPYARFDSLCSQREPFVYSPTMLLTHLRPRGYTTRCSPTRPSRAVALLQEHQDYCRLQAQRLAIAEAESHDVLKRRLAGEISPFERACAALCPQPTKRFKALHESASACERTPSLKRRSGPLRVAQS